MELIKNAKNPKPIKTTPMQNSFLLEQQARHILNDVVYGKPTMDRVYLKVEDGDVTLKDGRPMLNAMHFEVLAVGSEVKDKKAIKPGAWIQIAPGARIVGLDWGDQKNVLIKEFEVDWVFEGNPKLRLQHEIESERSKIKNSDKDATVSGSLPDAKV